MKGSFGKSVHEFREAVEAFRKDYGDQFVEELKERSRFKAPKVDLYEMDEEGNIYKEDYAYADIAAENCSNL